MKIRMKLKAMAFHSVYHKYAFFLYILLNFISCKEEIKRNSLSKKSYYKDKCTSDSIDLWDNSCVSSFTNKKKDSLFCLSLSGLKNYPIEIQEFSNLRKLEISNSKLFEIIGLHKNNNLVVLNLCFNRHLKLNSDIFYLSKLEILALSDLDSINLALIINNLEKFKKLQELHLFSSKIKNVPFKLPLLPLLCRLNLSDNPIIEIPLFLKENKNLKDFKCTDCELKSLNNIYSLVNLQELNLRKNNISFIKDSIKNLHELRYLNLSENNIKDLPIQISSLINLEYLYLDGNEHLKIKTEVAYAIKKNLKKLKVIVLFHTNMSKSEEDELIEIFGKTIKFYPECLYLP